jgi:hypothetical protein
MERMGGTWPSLVDPASRIAIDYGVYGVPETYFIGKDGIVAHKQIGPVSAMLMKQLVDSLLAAPVEGEPSTTTSMAEDVPVGRSTGHVTSPEQDNKTEAGGS